ncbi:MAG: DUF4363 family protein [Oscillospiraceae bacterium]
MKKEIFAAALLAVILALSLINTHYLSSITTEISGLVEKACAEAESDNWDMSEKYAMRAMDIWHGSDGYTHIVLRHSDIDSMTDDFYELMDHIYEQELGGVKSSSGLVIAHLESMRDMERIRLGSIF